MIHFSYAKKSAAALFATIFAIFPFYLFVAHADVPTSIVVTEIGIRETADYEWIEIYNPTNAAIDMTGWKFYEETTNHGLAVFRGTAAISPGEYAIISNKSDLFAAKYPTYTGTILDSSWSSLKEDGEEIGLKNAAGSFAELFTYPASTSASISLERIDVNTAASEPTNWAPHPDSQSMGKTNENSLPVTETPVVETTTDGTTSQVTETTTSTTQEAASIETPAAATESTTQETIQMESTEQSTAPTTVFVSSTPRNNPPKAIIQIQSGQLTAANSTTINFDGRASFDPDGDDITFAWDMGDGSQEITANPPPHKYGKPGNYKIQLTVTDSNGLTDTAEEDVHVLNVADTTPASVVKSSSGSAKPKAVTTPLSGGQVALPGWVKKAATQKTKEAVSPFGFKIDGYISFIPNSDGSIQMTFSTGSTKASKTKKPTSADDEEVETTTPKKSGKFSDGDLSQSVRINEVFAKPGKQSDTEEWIELANESDEPINLGNWTIQDSSKKKPYVFADTIGIAANSYLILPKSETKIALNDTKESLLLKDYTGAVTDKISYEGAVENKSYALFTVRGGTSNKSTWQWTSNMTPGKSNPALEWIEGSIEQGDAEKISVRTADASIKEVLLTSDAVDPTIAPLLTTKGSSVKLLASETSPNSYTLAAIDEVHPAEKPAPESEANTWLLVTGVSGIGLLNAPRAWEFLQQIVQKMKA